MIDLFEYFLLALAVGLLLPSLLLMIECLLGAIPHRSDADAMLDHKADTQQPTIDVLVPAHNEASVIARTLRSIKPQLRSTDRLLVVADNCTDTTASIARSMGAEVIQRQDESNRAKGFAVSAGLQHLQADSRDVVIMIDADCLAQPGSLAILAREASVNQTPIQACYQMPQPKGSDTWNAVSAFAVKVKNQVRPLGLSRLGCGCALTGSGMAFPAALARIPKWASDNIVEDMKISYDLMVAGYSPRYCPESIVTAELPSSRDVAMDQRKRWEHGHLQTLVTQVPRLIVQSFVQMRPGLLIAAFDLLVPPLSLFVQLWCMLLLMTALISIATGISLLPLGLTAISGTGIFVGIGVAWLAHGRQLLSPRDLVMIPLYVISKLPLYVAAVLSRQREWKRTAREAEGTACT